MRLGALVCQKAALDLDIQHGLILSTAAVDRRSVARWANSPTAHGPRRNAPQCHGPTAHGACVLRNMPNVAEGQSVPNVAERQSERAQCGRETKRTSLRPRREWWALR